MTIVLLGAVAIAYPPSILVELRSFNSYYQLSSYVLQRTREYRSYLDKFYGPVRMDELAQPVAITSQVAGSYTTTNVQVEGVDEPDIAKTDGTYIYAVSQNRVFLVLAYPPEQSRIVSTLNFNGTVDGIFVSEDRLAVVETGHVAKEGEQFYGPDTRLIIYDITDRAKPVTVKEISIPGSYINSRLTEGYIYAVIQQPAIQYPSEWNVKVTLPTIKADGSKETLPPSRVYYSPSSKAPVDVYTIVIAVRIQDGTSNSVSALTGMGSTIYASFSNIYVAYPENPIIFRQPLLAVPGSFAPSFWGGFGGNTTIFRFSISSGQVNVAASGTIPGGILNQFSMDEYDGYFRVATTSFRQEYNGNYVQVNNVYVLDQSLNIVGSLEGLASKESIYAVRFLGDRAYVVTFEKIDPLFAISLDNPTQPRLLDKLVMPGFSQYLHPIGNGYLIGIGKEAVEAEQGDFAWYQGLKLSLFHADDNGNLTEVAKLLIGDRGSDSPVLYDHRSFTYDPERTIMALPLMIAMIDKGGFIGTPPPDTYGVPVWQGAYVFRVSSEGFELLGKVTHIPEGRNVDGNYELFVNRVTLIGDFVYTLSSTRLEVNSLLDFANVAAVHFT